MVLARTRVPWPTSPEALRSATGCVVPPPQSLLWPHLRLSPPPADLCIRRQVFASQPAVRGSPLLSTRVCQRAAFLTPTDQAGAFGCYFPARRSLRRYPNGSASVSSAHTGSHAVVSRGCKVRLMLRPADLLALHRQGLLLSSFHLRSHLPEMSSMTTRVHSQFPRPDLHRQHAQHCGLRRTLTDEAIA